MTDEVHLLDEGTIVRITIKEKGAALDLTTATSIKMKFQRKDRSTFMVDGAVYGPAINGVIFCTSDIAYFTKKGSMTVQVYLEFPSGKWHTTKGEFTVNENIIITP